MNNIWNSIYLITSENTTISEIESSLKSNIKIIQLRYKKKSNDFWTTIIKQCIDLKEKYEYILIINDNIDMSLKYNVDGIHIGQDELKEFNLKYDQIVKKKLIVGITVHNLNQAQQVKNVATYFGLGSCFSTTTKLDVNIIDKNTFNEISNLNIPVVAIGGINKSTINNLSDYNFNGICIISAIWNNDIESSIKFFKNWMDRYNITHQRYGQGFYNENIISSNLITRKTHKDKDIIDRSNEIKVLKSIENYEYTKKTIKIYEDESYIYNISEFIDGTNFIDISINDTLIKKFYKTIKSLHEIKVTESIKTFDIFEINNLYQMNYNDQILSILNKRIQKFKVISHNDISKNNTLLTKDNKVYLIDFEYASLNDPYFDIAHFILKFSLNNNQKDSFLRYFDIITEDVKYINYWIDFINKMWKKHIVKYK